MRFPIINFNRLFKPKPSPEPKANAKIKVRQTIKGYLFVGHVIKR